MRQLPSAVSRGSAMAAWHVLYSGRDAPRSWLLLHGSGDAVRDYVLTLLVTAAVTYLLTPLVRRLAARIGAMKEPRDRDVHVAPVPLIGGVAMFGGLVAGLLVADQIPLLRDDAFTNTGMVSGLLLAGGLLVVIGIIDDRWGMSALTKGAGQVAAGAILVATGTTVNWLPLPGGNTYVPTNHQATLLTILIVVATINAVNFIDGLDGLAAGIVCIAAVSFFVYYYSLTRVIEISSLAAPALASAILIGICIGFLPHNFAPATIFMGDTGAMLLGLLLAYAPISSIPSLQPALLTHQINRYPVIMPLLLPAALLVIPYADLLLAVVRRTRAGLSPFAPDRKHLHHRLLDIGHSQRASVLIMYLWAAVFSGIVVWLSIQRTVQPRGANHHGQPVLVFVAITAAAVVALLLIALPKLRWWGSRDRPDEPLATIAVGPGPAAAVAAVAAVADGAAPAPASTRTAGFTAAPATSAATELRPPAAAPLAAPASAEPQLVTAAAGSRTSLLAAPVSQNGLHSPVPQNGTGSNWPEPDWTQSRGWVDAADPEWVRRAEPAAAAWTLGDRPRTERELLDFRPSGSLPSSAGAAQTGEERAAEERAAETGPAQVQPVPGRPAPARSIIGTPPPAVASLDQASAVAADDAGSEPGDAGSGAP
jgi:UDP-GlcNAc:undecaprenyl-phosphate/decaprenyl-phosphate GlcNAc-1-phosphate transferase